MSSSSLCLPSLTNPKPTKLHLPLTSHPFHRRHPLSLAGATFPALLTRCTASTPAAAAEPVSPAPTAATFRDRHQRDITVAVVGSTGYIGNFVVRELVRRGFNVVAVARERSGIRGRKTRSEALSLLAGAAVVFADATDPAALATALPPSVDVVVSCLASRSGGVRDSFLVDYQATANSLAAGRARGAAHFVLLSAICVQKPLLAFQRAKLKFESELVAAAAADPSFTYSIVRPTAFFKSLGGQVELVKSGKPYVVFGDGRLCACKPISEPDLASFIADCILDADKANRILPVGGPGAALTPLEQGEMLFRLLGKEPKFVKVPIGVMDLVLGVLGWVARLVPAAEDAAEFGRIGRYYAAESMLVWDPATGEYSAEKTPSYGKDTLEEFFERVIREGMAGQELGEQTIF